MTEIDREEGIILALISRFEKFRLPRLNDLKSRVDQGGQLQDSDIEFLEDLISDAMQNKHLFDKHPEWQGFCTNVVSLYEEISVKALDNEKR